MSAEYSSEWLWEHYQHDAAAWKLTDRANGFQCKRCGMWVTYVTRHAANVHGDDVIVKVQNNSFQQYDDEGRVDLKRQVWVLRRGRAIACFQDRDEAERALADLVQDLVREDEERDLDLALESVPLVSARAANARQAS